MQSQYKAVSGGHSVTKKSSTQYTQSNKQAAKYLVKFGKSTDLYGRKGAEIKRLREEFLHLKGYGQMLNALLLKASKDQKVSFDTRVIEKGRAELEKLEVQLEQLSARRDENAKQLDSVKDFLHFLTRTIMSVLKDINDQPVLLQKESERTLDDSLFSNESSALLKRKPTKTIKYNPKQNFSKNKKVAHDPKPVFKKIIRVKINPKRKSDLPQILNNDELKEDGKGYANNQPRFIGLPPDLSNMEGFEVVEEDDPKFLLDEFDSESEEDSFVDENESSNGEPNKISDRKRCRSKSLTDLKVDFQNMVNKEPINQDSLWSQNLSNYLACLTSDRSAYNGGRRMGVLKTLLTIQDFKKIKNHRRSTLKNRSHKYDELRNSLKKSGFQDEDEDEEVESVGSDIDASLLEDIEEELVEKGIIKCESVQQLSTEGVFSTAKLPKSFIPIKVSFKIGVEKKFEESGIQRKRDRIYRKFAIREIHWFLENGRIVGLRFLFLHLTERFFIEGQLHGKESEHREVFSLKENEIFSTIRFVTDQAHLLHVRLITSYGRQFKVGRKFKELMAEGKSSVVRYFPKEIMLFKIFSVFDTLNQSLAEIRFLYVRTVVY